MSRTQCKQLSIRPWSRTRPSRRPAPASSGPRLVIPYTTSTVVSPRSVRCRVSSKPCFSPGRLWCSVRIGVTRKVRRSSRPWDLSVVRATCPGGRGGSSGGKSRGDGPRRGLEAEPGGHVDGQPRLVGLDGEEVVAAPLDDLPGQVPLTEGGVAEDHLVPQGQDAEQ